MKRTSRKDFLYSVVPFNFEAVFLFFYTGLMVFNPLQGNAQLNAGPNDTINPGVPVTLSASYGNPGVPVTLGDDDVAGPFPIGFSFRFFGKNFTEFYIGSNGWMSFDPNPNSAGVRDPISVPNTFAQYPKNVIMGPWIDLLPKIVDTYVFYLTTGTAPNRSLVVMWCHVPMYFCVDSSATFQIILHEGSNSIENQIFAKQSCPGWNDNRATMGVQNGTGLIGFAVPGRNNTSFTANREGWLYTVVSADSFAIASIPFNLQPIIPGNKVAYNWYKDSEQFSGDQTVTVTPDETTWYYVTLDLCTGITLKDSVEVVVRSPIPDAFTPNGDGLNDVFRIMGTPEANITQFNFQIFDRWGQLVFTTTNISLGWDGKLKGQYCPPGIYVWEVFYETSGKKKVTNKGTVMLVR